jgi:hypothetical protein
MEESYVEDLANRDGPVHALAFREGAAKRWVRSGGVTATVDHERRAPLLRRHDRIHWSAREEPTIPWATLRCPERGRLG